MIMAGSGEVVTYRQLDERSNQLARLWRERGLVTGDHVAIFSENQPRFFEVMWVRAVTQVERERGPVAQPVERALGVAHGAEVWSVRDDHQQLPVRRGGRLHPR